MVLVLLGVRVSNSPLAQLVERETVNLEAVGSIPTWRVLFYTFSILLHSIYVALFSNFSCMYDV